MTFHETGVSLFLPEWRQSHVHLANITVLRRMAEESLQCKALADGYPWDRESIRWHIERDVTYYQGNFRWHHLLGWLCALLRRRKRPNLHDTTAIWGWHVWAYYHPKNQGGGWEQVEAMLSRDKAGESV